MTVPSEQRDTDYARDKHEGNALFNAGDIDGAIECWSKPMRSLTFILSKGEDFGATPGDSPENSTIQDKSENGDSKGKEPTNWEKFVSLYVALSLNLSLAYLKKGEYNKCIQYCESVLEREKNNAKAFFRAIQASIKLGNYKNAQQYCKQALIYHPNGEDFQSLNQRINSYMLKDEKARQKVMRNMIKSMDDPRITKKMSIVCHILAIINKLWALVFGAAKHYSHKLFGLKSKIF